MATSGKYGNKSMDRESAKRLASGVWKLVIEAGEDIWTCNVALLREKLHQMACSDHRMYEQYCKNPKVFLDARFGDMTAKAFNHYSAGNRISFRTNPYDDDSAFMKSYKMRMNNKYGYLHHNGTPETIKFERKLVRNLPLVYGGDSVADTLQREFDWWAGEQVKRLQSWVA